MVARLLQRFFRHSFAVPVTAGLLLLFFVVNLVRILGPAVAAEARYQLKATARAMGSEGGDWRSIFFPDIKVILKPEESVAEFGIVIPRIFVEEAVVPNVDPTDKQAYTLALRQGIAHAAGTGLPGDGQLGYYFAHSSDASLQASNLNAVFYLLGKLETGDVVSLWREGAKFDYRVTESFVTEPEDLTWLQADGEKEQIALQTCWPIGTSLKRLIVLAERVEEN